MCFSSGVRIKFVRGETCPKTRVPPEGFSCADRASRDRLTGIEPSVEGSGWRG